MTPKSTLSTSTLVLLPSSITTCGDKEFAALKTNGERKLVVLSDTAGMDKLTGERSEFGSKCLLITPVNQKSLDYLRSHLPWLNPCLLGLKTSAGMGDRVGLATPGHVRATRHYEGKIAPIFAQQSIREMTRTKRSPQQVMDDAVWGIFCEGWQGGFGADADHLKTTADIDACMAAGFTFFTTDPGDYVDNAETTSLPELRILADRLPEAIKPSKSGLAGKLFDFEGLEVSFDEATLLKAAVKYGRAVLHVADMYNHLVEITGKRPFELEVSVDETELSTSHAEHVYVAHEMKRLGVKWVSLAPRYIGRFEKGVDYIGDTDAFEKDVAGHAAIARALGPYKLSLHSGSDKFSIYAAAMRQTRGLVHLKTAGTSYLEALRTIGAVNPGFLREIYEFSRERFETDKHSYHLSGSLDNAPDPKAVTDWSALLNQFDAREILHVAFGSVLTDPELHPHLIKILQENPEKYSANLESHFKHHLSYFVAQE
jgi:hypothetical protein